MSFSLFRVMRKTYICPNCFAGIRSTSCRQICRRLRYRTSSRSGTRSDVALLLRLSWKKK